MLTMFASTASASVSIATAAKPGFFNRWRAANFRSFVTQCLHRLDFCGASGRQPAGEQCDDGEQRRYGREGNRIGRFDTKK